MTYSRTSAGTAAVLNPLVLMPRPVKVLLLAINSQFDPYLYATRLSNSEDVTAMLAELVRAGYIRASPGTPRQTLGSIAPQHVARAAPATPAITAASIAPAASPEVTANSRALQDAVTDITGFVMQHLPADALEISFALEGLSSALQLEASLGAYEAKIKHLGVPAAAHLVQIRQMLRQP